MQKTRNPVLSTVSELAAFNARDNDVIDVLGYNTEGDGGGGTFTFYAGLSAPSDDGLIFDGRGGQWVRKYEGLYLLPQWFGVIGNGVADDTVRFTVALQQAVTTNMPLYLPTSNYVLSTWTEFALENDDELTLIGELESRVTGPDKSTDFITLDDTAHLKITNFGINTFRAGVEYLATATAGSIELRDCRFENVYVAVQSYSGAAASCVIVEDCDISDFDVYGLNILGVDGAVVSIRNNKVHTSSSSVLLGGIVVGKDTTSTNHKIDVINNAVYDLTSSGGSTLYGILCNYGHINCKNNNVDGVLGASVSHGIYVMGDDVSILGNTIKNAGNGSNSGFITLAGDPAHSVILGNSLFCDASGTSNETIGINCGSSKTTIANNVIVNSSGALYGGVYAAGCHSININNNIIKGMDDTNAAPFGVKISTVDNLVVSENQIHNFISVIPRANIGIDLAGTCTNIAISNNRIAELGSDDHSSYGIYLRDGSCDSLTIDGNTIEDWQLGIWQPTSGMDVTSSFIIRNNTLTTDITNSTLYGIYLRDNSCGVIIDGNIFADLAGGTAAVYGMWLQSNDSAMDDVIVTNNIFKSISGTGTVYCIQLRNVIAANNYVVSNNVFTDCVTGIHVWDATDLTNCTILNNVGRNLSGSLISLTGSPNSTLACNGNRDDSELAGNTNVYDNGASGAAVTLDFGVFHAHKVTLDQDCTFTFTDPAESNVLLTLVLAQNVVGGHTVTWPSLEGIEPVVDETLSKTTIVLLFYDGTNYHTFQGL